MRPPKHRVEWCDLLVVGEFSRCEVRIPMTKMLFPDNAIDMLRRARWSADATRSFEIFSGGFHWSDECLSDVARICVESDNWSFRYVMAYRASLIRGTPRDELREPWDQLRIECPEWPGFRPERCDCSLAQELDRESQKAMDDLDEFDQKCNMAARSHPRNENQS